MRTRIAAIAVTSILSLPVAGETAVRITPDLGLNSGEVVDVGGRALLVVPTSAFLGADLWATDGTRAGTHFLVAAPDYRPSAIGVTDGAAYFQGPGGGLWRSDATLAGTAQVVPNQGWLGIRLLAASGGRIWFFVDGASGTPELWTTDGTLAATQLVGFFTNPENLLVVNDVAVFTCWNGGQGRIWSSDGSAAGTYPLALDAEAGASFGPYRPRRLGDFVYFAGRDSLGAEPWRTGGTPASTSRIADLTPGAGSSQPVAYTPVLGQAFFTALDLTPGLWVTDGTSGGTRVVTSSSGRPSHLKESGPLVFFDAQSAQGLSLFRSDGTAAGTFALVGDLGDVATTLTPDMAADAAGRLVFAACEASSGCELWISDGSVSGTRLFADVVPGPGSSNARSLGMSAGHVLFVAQGGWWSVALPTARTPDFDRNGYADLCWQGADQRLSLWLLRGTEAIETVQVRPDSAPLGTRLAACGDLDGDGAADLLFRDVLAGTVEVRRMRGSESLESRALPYRSSASLTLAGVADLDGDSRNDLLWHDPGTGLLSAWLMAGFERRDIASTLPGGIPDTQWRPAGLGDFDGDGQADLLWRHEGTGQLRVWQMAKLNRRGELSLDPQQAGSLDWRIQSVLDLDSDGDADLVWRHRTTGRLAAWIMDGAMRIAGRLLSPAFAP